MLAEVEVRASVSVLYSCTSVGGCNSAAGDGCHPWPGGCIRSGGYTLVTVGGVLVVG